MSDLDDLYQQVIIDHSRRPRNFRIQEAPACKADGYNPLCGDKVTIFAAVEGGVIRDLSFQGSGCAISTASASLLTETLKGKTVEQAQAIFETFHAMVKGTPVRGAAELGKLAAFAGVSQYPMRVKCATLAWHTLKSALESGAGTVSTE